MNQYPPYNNRYPPPPNGNQVRPDARHPSYQYPPPPAPSYRPYDPYASDHLSLQQHPYEQPRPPPGGDSYDPYRPSPSAYDPGHPGLQIPNQYRPPPPKPYGAPLPRPISPVRDNGNRANAGVDHSLLTPPTSVNVDGHTTVVHTLPNSHLPITKYVAVNRDDAIQLQAHLATRQASIWYAEGSNRAGEGWSAAVEWIFDPGRSGSKMRGCVGEGDALDSELGGIFKAVEGFHEQLRLSLKHSTIMPNHLIIFSSSQAAVVSVDTSTRPEALKFDALWRDICSEFLNAHLTLAWLPHHESIEGQVLAEKIALVAASNAYQKRRREGSLPDIYRRPGGGEPAPSGSSMPGNWQRGDAEPSWPKVPFDRPIPRVRTASVEVPASDIAQIAKLPLDHQSPAPTAAARPDFAPDDEIPKEGSVFVTNFPERATAKDIGILFSEFGSIESVDIYHVSPQHPRLAYVAFIDPSAGITAIETLHRRPISLDSPAVAQNPEDYDVWRDWNDTLTVVRAEPPALIPSSVVGDFADLPEWAQRGSSGNTATENNVEPHGDRKRERMSQTPAPAGSDPNSALAAVEIASPRKRIKTSADPPSVSSAHGSPNLAQSRAPLPVSDSSLGLTAMGSAVSDRPRDTDSHPANVARPTIANEHVKSTSTPPPVAPPAPRLPPTPESVSRPAPIISIPLESQTTLASQGETEGKPALTNSAAEPQEHPIKMSAKTLRGLIDLTRDVFPKHENNNWIAHSCLIAFELDQARRALQGDLFATDEAFLTGREHEQVLFGRGFASERVDAFIKKVLKVLDGIAAAEDEVPGEDNSVQNIADLQQELETELSKYPNETKEAVLAAGKVMEYLLRGKDLQEKKRLDIERRVKVLEGMVKIGEIVGGVVRFLLTDGN